MNVMSEKDFVKQLRKELPKWRKSNLISETQRDKILSHYNIHVDRSKKLVAILSILGSILIGVGIILFVASNWRTIPRYWRVILLITALLASYAAGFYLKFKKQMEKTGMALVLLGTLIFGANIFLIAQMYNINAHYPNGVLFWCLGALLVAYSLRSKIILSLTVVLAWLWSTMETTGFEHANYWFIPLFAVLVYLAYNYKSVMAITLSILAGGYWLFHNGFYFIDHSYYWDYRLWISFLIMMLYGVIIYSLAKHHEKSPILNKIFKFLGYLGITVPLYSISMEWFLDTMPKGVFFIMFSRENIIILILSLIMFAAALYLTVTNWRKAENVISTAESTFSFSIIILLLIPYLLAMNSGLTKLFSVYFSILVFLTLLGFIFVGYKDKEELYINAAIVVFVIEVITLYFRYAWAYLDRSIFFIVGGIILVAGGIYLEKGRRKFIGEVIESKG